MQPTAKNLIKVFFSVITGDLQLFSVLPEYRFKQTMAIAEPRYRIPSLSQFRLKIIPEAYKGAALKLKAITQSYMKDAAILLLY